MNFFRNKIVLSLTVIMMVASLLVGCSKEVASEQSKQKVLTINNKDVFLDEALIYAKIVESEYEYYAGTDIWETDFDGKTANDMAKESVIDRIVRIKVVLDKAKELKIKLTDEETKQIQEQAKSFISTIPDEVKAQTGATEKLAIKILTENMLVTKAFEQITKDFEVDEALIDEKMAADEEIKYYEQMDLNEALYKVRAKHILIKTIGKDESGQDVPFTEEQKKAALDKANEVLAKAKAGEDFAKLVKEYSEDEGSLATDGEYTFPRGQMVPEFENAAFSMKAGEISDIVETSYGYHIIKVEDPHVNPSQEEINKFKESLETYKQDRRGQYAEEQKSLAFDTNYQDWKQEYTVTVNNEVWDTVVLGKVAEPQNQTNTENNTEPTKED